MLHLNFDFSQDHAGPVEVRHVLHNRGTDHTIYASVPGIAGVQVWQMNDGSVSITLGGVLQPSVETLEKAYEIVGQYLRDQCDEYIVKGQTALQALTELRWGKRA